jgi:hypothetical protein
MRQVSRRAFGKGLAASIMAVYGTPFLTRAVWAEAAMALGLPNVAVVSGSNADSAETYLRTTLEALGGMTRFVKPGQSVCIKVNVTWDAPPFTASNTDPELLRAMIKLVREAGAGRVIVADHVIGSETTASVTLPLSGIGKVLDETRVVKAIMAGVDETDDKYLTISAPKSKSIDGKTFGVIRAATEADVRINMAVAKSHIVTPVTMTLKHMMGLMRYPGYLHSVNLDQGIADICTADAIRADLHLLEAFRVRLTGAAWGWGNESQADARDPTGKKIVKRFNQILAGTDPVLIDSYGANVFFKGYKPEAKGILHILRAYQAGLGEMDVEKALAEGRLQVFTAGKPVALATATVLQAATTSPTAQVTPTASTPVTGTPLAQGTPSVRSTSTARSVAPTLPPAPTFGAQTGSGSAQVSRGDTIVDYVPVLAPAMGPVVAIIAAVGLVVRRRMALSEKRSPAARS